jgi:hypothetical protein
MNKNYVIQWKSTINGRAGRGTKTFDKSEGEKLVQELNKEYPQIVHEVVEASAISEAAERRPPAESAMVPMLSIA